MFFKNAVFFRISPALLHNLIDGADGGPALEPALAAAALKPIGPLEVATFGFVPPIAGESSLMVERVGDHALIALAGEQKIIPPSTVNRMLAKRVAEAEKREGRRPGGRARKRMKDELVTELLPKALTRPSLTLAILNLKHGYVAIDTPTRKTAENVVSHIRAAVGTFPALPLNAEVAPRSVLTGWAIGEVMPEGVQLGDELELRDASDAGAVIKCKNHDIQSEEIGAHLDTGMQVARLALCIDDHATLVLDDALTIRRFRLLDGATESLDGEDHEDILAELRGRLALNAAELQRTFEVLESAMKLSGAEG